MQTNNGTVVQKSGAAIDFFSKNSVEADLWFDTVAESPTTYGNKNKCHPVIKHG